MFNVVFMEWDPGRRKSSLMGSTHLPGGWVRKLAGLTSCPCFSRGMAVKFQTGRCGATRLAAPMLLSLSGLVTAAGPASLEE